MRFYRVCGHTSHILQLEERPWSVSTAIVAVREPSRTGNRGAAAPIFWPGRRCLPELAEGDRKVGCRRPTFLKSAKRRQMIWFCRLGSHVFSDAREQMDVLCFGMGTPPREPVSRDSRNRSRRFWMAVNRKSRRAVMRGGESQKVVSGHGSNRNWKRTNGHSPPRCCSCRNRHRQRYQHLR